MRAHLEEEQRVFRSILVLAEVIVGVFGVPALGGLFTRGAIPTWYAALRKPSFTPPDWVFGPVWTFLYLSMAVSAWLVWRKAGFEGAAKAAFVLFAAQLALNAAWTPVFFGAHRIGAALVIIVLLWAAILATMVSFWRITPPAGWFLLPYQLWVTLATALNYEIWRLNR